MGGEGDGSTCFVNREDYQIPQGRSKSSFRMCLPRKFADVLKCWSKESCIHEIPLVPRRILQDLILFDHLIWAAPRRNNSLLVNTNVFQFQGIITPRYSADLGPGIERNFRNGHVGKCVFHVQCRENHFLLKLRSIFS